LNTGKKILYSGVFMAEPVMGPIIAILIGALLIAIGVYSAATTALWIGIVVSLAGVATILVGLVMLVGLANANADRAEMKK
jgi:hypothetical protein